MRSLFNACCTAIRYIVICVSMVAIFVSMILPGMILILSGAFFLRLGYLIISVLPVRQENWRATFLRREEIIGNAVTIINAPVPTDVEPEVRL